MKITAQDLYNYTQCLHRVYLDTNGPSEEKSEVNRFVKLLWELGVQTEEEYLKTLEDIQWEDLQDLSINDGLIQGISECSVYFNQYFTSELFNTSTYNENMVFGARLGINLLQFFKKSLLFK